MIGLGPTLLGGATALPPPPTGLLNVDFDAFPSGDMTDDELYARTGIVHTGSQLANFTNGRGYNSPNISTDDRFTVTPDRLVDNGRISLDIRMTTFVAGGDASHWSLWASTTGSYNASLNFSFQTVAGTVGGTATDTIVGPTNFQPTDVHAFVAIGGGAPIHCSFDVTETYNFNDPFYGPNTGDFYGTDPDGDNDITPGQTYRILGGAGNFPGVIIHSIRALPFGGQPAWLTALENEVLDTIGQRLSLTSGVPVTTADVGGAGTLYFTSYKSAAISLYTSSVWTQIIGEASLALSGLTSGKNYDVFAYSATGTLTLELSAAWTNDTTRADALTRQNGVLVKNSDTSRRYVGTFRATGTGTTEDSFAKRFLYNQYNQVRRDLRVFETSTSWAGNGASTFGPANANAANCFEFICGDVTDLCVDVSGLAAGSTPNIWDAPVGIGIDSTSTNSAPLFGMTAGAFAADTGAHYKGYTAAGYHKVTWLELSSNSGVTFYSRADASYQSGMVGSIQG